MAASVSGKIKNNLAQGYCNVIKLMAHPRKGEPKKKHLQSRKLFLEVYLT